MTTKANSKYYDIISEHYEKGIKSSKDWYPPQIVSKLVSKVINPNDNILDIGIGTGLSSKPFYDKYQITGIDVSAKMLEVYKNKFPEIKTVNEDFLQWNSNEQYSIIICCGVFEFIDKWKLLIRKVKEMLEENGHFIFTYEPMLENHSAQRYRKSMIIKDKSHPLYVENFYTYRHNFISLEKYINKIGLKIIEQKPFVAYKRSNGEGIIYDALLVKRVGK